MRVLPALLLAACVSHQLPDPVAKTGPKDAEAVPMSDGAELFTRIYYPKGDGPWPVVFIRVPYPMGPILRGRCRILNKQGYVCAYQHTRGRGRSDGEWLPFENEVDDGLEALEWIADQPWCDGNIGMMGESYLGASTWAVAHDPPAELKTIVPIVIGTELYDAAYEGGMFRHDILTAWMSLMPSEHEFRYSGGSHRYHKALKTRPRKDMDLAAYGEHIDWFQAWTQADTPDHAFWHRPIVEAARETPAVTPIPVFSVGGWSDAFLGIQLRTWENLGSMQQESLWVIGPWNHLTMVPASVGQRPVRDKEKGLAGMYQQWPILLDWYDHHLKGEPLESKVGGVWTFTVNRGEWDFHEQWPVPDTEARTFALATGEDAQRCTGALVAQSPEDASSEDALLAADAPSAKRDSGTTSFVYDPEDPTPSRGGSAVLAGSFPMWKGAAPGFLHQKRLCEKRDDLVGFVSEPFAEDTRALGAFSGKVAFSTDAEDTAVNVRILEERKDGRRIHVRETIVALSHRDVADPTYTPGQVAFVPYETWPVDYVFEEGSRLLVEFASASFPKYEAHANVAGHWAEVTETTPATQKVHHAGTTVTMPVAP